MSILFLIILNFILKKVLIFKHIIIIIFFWFLPCFLKTFTKKLITVCNEWANSEVNRWPMEFFKVLVPKLELGST